MGLGVHVVCVLLGESFSLAIIHYSKKLKEHFDIMIFIERYPLKRCQGCVKLIAMQVKSIVF